MRKRLLSLLLLLTACQEEFHPLTPPVDPVCQGPPIEQNIIGTWQAGIRPSIPGDTTAKTAPFTKATFTRFGGLSFDQTMRLIDPDSLFGNQVDGRGPVVAKSYSVETDTVPTSPYYRYGQLFWVREYAKDRQGVTGYAAGYYFKVVQNECNRIYLKGPDGAKELVLVRQ